MIALYGRSMKWGGRQPVRQERECRPSARQACQTLDATRSNSTFCTQSFCPCVHRGVSQNKSVNRSTHIL